jgi:hypothetical protein
VFPLLLLLYCFIFIPVLLLCYLSRSSLYCNISTDLYNLCLSCYYFYIVLSLCLYCCYVMYLDHHFTVIYLQTCVLCVSLLLLLHCFIVILVLLLCCVSRSSLYCNIPSDLCTQSWMRKGQDCAYYKVLPNHVCSFLLNLKHAWIMSLVSHQCMKPT